MWHAAVLLKYQPLAGMGWCCVTGAQCVHPVELLLRDWPGIGALRVEYLVS